MGTGQEFVRRIGPVAAALVLLLFAVVTVFLFTGRGIPVEGYTPPADSAYYREHLEALAAELEEHLFPLAGVEDVTATVEAGKIVLYGAENAVGRARLAAIHYYDPELITIGGTT